MCGAGHRRVWYAAGGAAAAVMVVVLVVVAVATRGHAPDPVAASSGRSPGDVATAVTPSGSGTPSGGGTPSGSTPASGAATAAGPAGAARAGWSLAWADEFGGSALDPAKWAAENNSTYGDGNNELACLMNRPANLFLSGGSLTLRARREATAFPCGTKDTRFPAGRSYTSAMITTKGKVDWTYGRFEIRAKLPTQALTSKGLWPAFWARPTSGGTGELDILEAIGTDANPGTSRTVVHTIHYDYTGTYPKQGREYTFGSGAPSDGFHTYAVEWEYGQLRWYVDDKLTFSRDSSTTPWLNDAFSKPFYLRVNLAVGGNWPGSPSSATSFPADYTIDHVRVYRR